MSDLLSQASLVMIPSGYKEDVVYSPIPTNGSGDLSFTRASNGTRVNSAGLVEVVPWNLFGYSETFNNGYWDPSLVTITANTTIAPNGTLTADTFVSTGTISEHRVRASTNMIGSSQYFVSIYVKKVDVRYAYIRDLTNNTASIYDLQDGVVSTSTGTSTSIIQVGNFYLITMSWTTPSTIVNNLIDFGMTISPSSFSSLVPSGNSMIFWGAQLNIGSTAKPYFPTTDRLNVPRLTYQNGCPSLLLEKQSTNINTYSEQINSTNYTLSNVTSSENSLTSPDGTINADKIIENTSNSTHSVNRVVALGGTVDSSAYSVSVFAKAEGRSQIVFYDNNQNVGGITYFNLSTGVVSSGTGKIENFGNGWYRCTIFCLIDLSTTANLQFFLLDSAGNQTYTGNGTSGIGLWGYQVEASSYPTSYIPTTSASATRVADACYKTGISSLVGASEYTLCWDGSHIPTGQYNSFMTIYQTSNENNSARFYRNNTNNEVRAAIFNQANALTLDMGSSVTAQRIKCALRVKNADFALFVNGVKVNNNSTALAPSSVLDSVNLQYFNNTQSFGQNCSMACFFKSALTDAECISLTTI
jgi:hypothetical protein